MNTLNWIISTNSSENKPEIVSEYLLNDIGIFIKREQHISKKAPLTALTGFRIGYTAVKGTDYRSSPLDRNAILWHKITSIVENSNNELIVKGNKNDIITIIFEPENKNEIIQYISNMQRLHPVMIEPDYTAASWLCWRDDDEWEDPLASLSEMLQSEADTERFIEPEILEETDLTGISVAVNCNNNSTPKFCGYCGAAIIECAKFCGKCGAKL